MDIRGQRYCDYETYMIAEAREETYRQKRELERRMEEINLDYVVELPHGESRVEKLEDAGNGHE